MKEFDQQLLRLKQALDTTEDQKVAGLLGLSKAAFAARKKRDAFPGDLLATLSLERPELKIDVHWVLHGATQYRAAVDAAAGVASSGQRSVNEQLRHMRVLTQAADHITPLTAADQVPNAIVMSADEHKLLQRLRKCTPRDQLLVMNLITAMTTLVPPEPPAMPAPSKKPGTPPKA